MKDLVYVPPRDMKVSGWQAVTSRSHVPSGAMTKRIDNRLCYWDTDEGPLYRSYSGASIGNTNKFRNPYRLGGKLYVVTGVFHCGAQHDMHGCEIVPINDWTGIKPLLYAEHCGLRYKSSRMRRVGYVGVKGMWRGQWYVCSRDVDFAAGAQPADPIQCEQTFLTFRKATNGSLHHSS